ncbi:nucleoporin Nup37 isoform 2-T2 [Spinachia spinachia]
MQEDCSRGPSYTVTCDDYVHVVEFSPFGCGSPASLLAYGGNQYVVVGTCQFQEEDMEIEGVEFNVLRAFHHDLRVDALAWSPESRLDGIPTLRFCTAAADRKLRLLTSDLQQRHEVKVMEGHTSYINHLVFEPTEGKQIASVSDDHTCRVWDLDGTQSCALRLRSPGVSVCWHPEEAFKVGGLTFSRWLPFWGQTLELRVHYPVDGGREEGNDSLLRPAEPAGHPVAGLRPVAAPLRRLVPHQHDQGRRRGGKRLAHLGHNSLQLPTRKKTSPRRQSAIIQVVPGQRKPLRHHRMSGKDLHAATDPPPGTPTAGDGGLGRRGIGSQLAPDAPAVRDRWRQEAQLLDDRNVDARRLSVPVKVQ